MNRLEELRITITNFHEYNGKNRDKKRQAVIDRVIKPEDINIVLEVLIASRRSGCLDDAVDILAERTYLISDFIDSVDSSLTDDWYCIIQALLQKIDRLEG